MTGLRQFILLVVLLLSGSPLPGQSGQSGSSLRAADLRVATIAYRLALAGRSYCSQVYPLTGLLMHHLPEYGEADRKLLIGRYGLDRGPGVLAVIANSPAERAGLVAGDIILAVNGKRFPDARLMALETRRQEWRKQIIASEAMFEEEAGKGAARLSVLRDGGTITATIDPVSGCPGRVRLARSDQLNAFANDGYAILTTRILDFVRNDDELAIVVGHEMAHVILDHAGRLKAEKVPGGLLRSVGRNASRVHATEEEADRLGLRLAWAAGYDVTAAVEFWRRFYARKGPDLQIFRTHPSRSARERSLQEMIDALARDPRASTP